MTVKLIVFILLGIFIIVSSILAVTTKRMMRAATYLLFVLIGTAGLYFLLNYHFLAAVQLAVYAGGVLVLFLFAIFLTSGEKGDKTEPQDKKRAISGTLIALSGIGITFFIIMKNKFLFPNNAIIEGNHEINMKVIGFALMGTEKYQYLLPFEALSILLLACIIGGVLIARKR